MNPIYYEFQYTSRMHKQHLAFYRATESDVTPRDIVFCRKEGDDHYTVHHAAGMSVGAPFNIWSEMAQNPGALLAIEKPNNSEIGEHLCEWLAKTGYKMEPAQLRLSHEAKLDDTPEIDDQGCASIPWADCDGEMRFVRRTALGEFLFSLSTFAPLTGDEHRYFARAEYDAAKQEWRFYVTDSNGNYVGVKRWYYTFENISGEIYRATFPALHRESADTNLRDLVMQFRIQEIRVIYHDA